MTTLELMAAGWWQRIASVDKALAATVGIFAALLLTAPDQAGRSAVFVGESVLAILPFLFTAVAIAAYASASGADNLIARAFQGSMAMMIVFAALMGGLSPFCSCGVIPLIAALLAMGVPLAPVMAFWLASPLMDPTMFMVTAGTLGMEFAVAKTVAAILVGMMGGFAMLALVRLPAYADPLREGVGGGGCGGARIRVPKAVVWPFWREEARRAAFLKGAGSNLVFLGKWLILAYVLESLMLAYVPAAWIAAAVGDGGLASIGVASLVGVPAYLNGYAALPLVAGLMDTGMAPGACMAFLIAGGMTSIPAAIAVFALARLPVFAAYLTFALAGSMASGLAYQFWVTV